MKPRHMQVQDSPKPVETLDSSQPESSKRRGLSGLIQSKLNSIVTILQSGVSPRIIALSFSVGVTCGVFPVPATTTFICLLAVWLFRLNIIAVQVVNLCMTPLNLLTFVPFIRCGEVLFGVNSIPISFEPFKADPLAAIFQFWTSLILGIIAWLIFVGPATLALYLVLKPLVKFTMEKLPKKEPSSPHSRDKTLV